MKKIYFMVMLCITYISSAQTLSYNDLGVLFSKENINGTARFNAMSGAFGALGGDLSAIDINPAGAAVFTKSEFAASLSLRNTKINSNYYGNNEVAEDDFLNLSQAGGVFVFERSRNSDWGKIAIGFNYSIANDFESSWFARGNSGFAPFTDIFDDTLPLMYPNNDGQYFETVTNGKNNKYSFTFASQYNENLYIGASINSYSINLSQKTFSEEYASNDSDLYDVSLFQESYTFGEGISINLGLISKLNNNARLGLAYQSPIWYNLTEEYYPYDLMTYLNNNLEEEYYYGINNANYKLRTPSKLTGSFAYIFDKQGLISIDYTYKNYSNLKLSNDDFTSENQEFKDNLKSRGELRVGTEWRFDKISVRGGYHIEKSPNKDAINSDSFEGYSLGVGFKFRSGKFDIAYQKNDRTEYYNTYSNYSDITDRLINDNTYNSETLNQLQKTKLNFDTSKITATLVFNL